MTDTIYALSTPVGGAIAVIRISGPDTPLALKAVFDGKTHHRYLSHNSMQGFFLCSPAGLHPQIDKFLR